MNRTLTALALGALIFVSAVPGCGSGSGSGPTATVDADGSGTPPFTNPGSGQSNDPALNLSWQAPDTNVDGTTLTDLAGYKVYYGTAPGTYSDSVDVGLATNHAISGLAPGTYYAAVTAYTAAGSESSYSEEVTKTIL